MADASAPSGDGGALGFLGKKIGPLPVWMWGLAGFGVYWWYTHYGPGASSSSAAGNATGQPLSNPEVVVVQGPRGQRGPRGRKPVRKPPKRKRTDRDAAGTAPAAGRFQAAPAQAGVTPMATQPGEAATAQAPVYDQYVAGDNGVPEPQAAYAPMTAGSIYG